jgi:hypothetical protein
MKHNDVLWRDRKRNALGLPWTFTLYQLTKNRLFVQTGFLNQKEDEIRLYRITDLTLTRSLWQRIIGTGTIHIDSSDKTMADFDLKNIRDSENIKEQLSTLVDKQRRENNVFARESLDSAPGPEGHGGHAPEGMGPVGDHVDFNGDGVDDLTGEHIH